MYIFRISFIFLILLFCKSAFSNEIVFPSCGDKKPLETGIHLYFDASILDEFTEEFVTSKVQVWLHYSNTVLKNSCIPIERKITKIRYVEDVDSSWFQSLPGSYALLKQSLDLIDNPESKNGIPIFTGLVFKSSKSSFKAEACGEAFIARNFFTLALDCSDFVFEHELGHLHGANHDHKTILSQDKSLEDFRYTMFPITPKYAFAGVCSDYGTVMSYEARRIAAYSNPEVLVNGEPCGNVKNSNNAEVLRSFALKYMK